MEFLNNPVTPPRSTLKKSLQSHLLLGNSTPGKSCFSATNPPSALSTGKRSMLEEFNSPGRTESNHMLSTTPRSGTKKTRYDKPIENPSTVGADRFIPNRKTIDFDKCFAELAKAQDNNENILRDDSRTCPTSISGTKRTSDALDEQIAPTPKRLVDVFNGCRTVSSLVDQFDESHILGCKSRTSISYSSLVTDRSPNTKKPRVLPSAPCRILDAPDMLDDYYLNLLNWGKNNILAVALRQSVYLWHPATGQIDTLLSLEDDEYVTSISWSDKDINNIAVGTSGNVVQLWDAATFTKTTEYEGHSARVSSLSWNGSTISSGGRDSLILHHDTRVHRGNSQQSYQGHLQEVCGLAWSPDGRTLASGGNENYLCLWDAAISGQNRTSGTANPVISPRSLITEHTAAVKALSWCPWQAHTLASGGGTADRKLKIWNTSLGKCTRSVDTGSQVCAIQWCDYNRELLSSHGFSDNQLTLWKYSTMTKIKDFRSHSARVLHLAKSPDGSTICSASSDETLCFWNIFEANTTASISGGTVPKFKPFGMSNLIR